MKLNTEPNEEHVRGKCEKAEKKIGVVVEDSRYVCGVLV